MRRFDVIVVGSGSGMMIADAAVNQGKTVALIEMGYLGGTCLNVGCIPSKMIIYPADIVNQIKQAKKLGINAKIQEIDFSYIMKRTREFIEHDRNPMEKAIKNVPGLTFYPVKGEFTDEYTIQVGDETITGDTIFLVSGARTLIPPIKGLNQIEYLTNDNVWDLDEKPERMVIVGGGLIAVEMGHFFSSMGVEVTLLSRSPRLVKGGEPEISEILLNSMRQRMHIETGVEVTKVQQRGEQIQVTATQNGEPQTHIVDSIFIAAGRKSNADLLKVEKTGVKVDSNGYIIVDELYNTTKKNIIAFGDAVGPPMFRHVANRQAQIAWNNYTTGHGHPLDLDKIPYAVFSWPQIGAVGLTEADTKQRGIDYIIGEYNYRDTAKGAAMAEMDGYVKILLERQSHRILGGHIIGPYAPILIQEIINVMNAGQGSVQPLTEALHIHPALPEVVHRAFFNLREP